MDLQLTWYVLVAVLIAGYAVLDGYDLGIGALYPFLAHGTGERASLRTSIGPYWDGNEVWLITGGGALFAAFPPVYAMTFSGFYLAIMLVLFGLILRAVALEFRHRDEGRAAVWDAAFFVGSLVPALLFGVAAGNIIRGVPLDANGDYAGTFWGLLNPFALLVGVTGLAMFISHGAVWAALKTEGPLQRRSLRTFSGAHLLFVALVAGLTVYTAVAVSEQFKHNLTRPMGWVMIAALVIGIAATRVALARANPRAAFLGSAAGIVALVGLAAVGNYPYLVPARGASAIDGLAVHGASSSALTLKVMLIIAVIGLPIVLAYSVFVYRTFKGRVGPGTADY
jgi:cytochrome d ubiquinol oxidase subunit II